MSEMILASGSPRSETTWIGKVLSRPKNIFYRDEPDNEHENLLGYLYKQHLHRFPYLTADDPPVNGLLHIYDHVALGNYLFGYNRGSLIIKKLLEISPGDIERKITANLERLEYPDEVASPARKICSVLALKIFQLILLFNRNMSNYQRILVKSVHSILALPFIQHYFHPDIVLVLRHPANIVLSYRKLENPDIHRNIFMQENLIKDYLAPFLSEIKEPGNPLEKAGAQVGAFYFVLAEQLPDHPEWLTAKHEKFCRDPYEEFIALYEQLGLSWSEEVEN